MNIIYDMDGLTVYKIQDPITVLPNDEIIIEVFRMVNQFKMDPKLYIF